MTGALALFLPGDDDVWRWLRIADDAIIARGEGVPAAEEGLAVIAIAPAAPVTLHWAGLPDRSTAQGLAAARLLVAEASASPVDHLHVAIGREGDAVNRPIAVVAHRLMIDWLAALAANGVDADAIVPAALLLPPVEEGYLSADLGGERVVRGRNCGFADEAGLTDMITGGEVPVLLSRDGLEAAIVAAVATPPLNLRQGPYARRRRRAIDWDEVRRLGWLIAAILLVTLLVNIARIVHYEIAASNLEHRADAIARTGLPRGETVNDAERQLTERLVGQRGAGAGFTQTTAAVFAAVRATPGAEISNIAFDGNGDLRATVTTDGEGKVIDVQRRIQAQGFAATPSTVSAAAGHFTTVFTVAAP